MAQPSWILRQGEVFTPPPLLSCGIMGIVNVTPDSFYDGGCHNTEREVLCHAHRLRTEGAHFLDIGAESSRPGAKPLAVSQELSRLMGIMRELCKARSGDCSFPFISVDTYHARTAALCLEAGVDIINDISACRFEPELLDIVAHYKPGYVLMHAPERGSILEGRFAIPNNANERVMDILCRFFEFHLRRLTAAGVPEERIILDPGIGFGKSAEQNFIILRKLKRLHKFGRPVLMGLSMKSLFALVCTAIPQEKTADMLTAKAYASQCATALLASDGICLVHRVHHVAQTLRTLQLVHAMRSDNP